MGRRGQVTIFIVLGIIIVAIIGTTIYYKDDIINSLKKQGILKQTNLPDEVQKIYDYTESCVAQTTIDGANILGSQGGYITMPINSIPITQDNPFSNKLIVLSSADMETPYWFYQTSNGLFKSQIPTIDDMESQLNVYVKENIRKCLLNLTSFDEAEITYSIVDVKTEINDESLLVDAYIPMNVIYKEDEFTFNQFKLQLDIPLGNLYKISKEIIDLENRRYFLEEKTVDILSVYEEIPLSGTDFDCTQKVWTKQEVTTNLQDIISYNIPLIKIKNTDYSPIEKYNGYFEVDAFSENYENVNVNFMFSKKWPFYLDVSPSENDILKPDSIIKSTGALSYLNQFLCLSNYHFIYDVKYPVLIMTTDPTALNGQGYSFQFATLVIIDNNQPRENLKGKISYETEQVDICKEANTEMTIYTSTYKQGQNIPLDDVSINFKCLSSSCDIGKTSTADGVLKEKFPQCINSVITAEKTGYYRAKDTVSTNKETTVLLNLDPIYELDYKIYVVDGERFRDPDQYEKVLFEFNNEEKGYQTSIVYPTSGDKIKLIPGTYKVKSSIIAKVPWPITISGKEVESCVDAPQGILGIFGVNQEKCTTIVTPDITLQEAVVGGSNFNFEIEQSTIENSKMIELYVLYSGIPKTTDDITNIYEEIEQNSLDSKFIYPILR